MRFVDLYNAISSGGAPAAERHYLQFNGTSDYAVADAVFGGISGDYTIAIKVAGRNAGGSIGSETYWAAGGPSAHTLATSSAYDYTYGRTSTAWIGLVPASGSVNYNSGAIASVPADTDPRVIATVRTATQARRRLIKASGVESTANLAATSYAPDHLSVGSRVGNDMVPIANRYGAVSFISIVLASVAIPDAELTAWLNGTDATDHITGIDHYWVASDIDGASIPARVGTVALALTGPTSSDLVAWSPS